MERAMTGIMQNSFGAPNARRVAAAMMIAVGLAAIAVHGKATRSPSS